MAQFTTLGAIAGLVIAIILIIKKVHPAYSLILGALIGGVIGGGGLTLTVNTMVSGASSIMSSVLRILTSGILAGTLAGIIKASNLQYDMINLLEVANLPAYLLAPLSGILMAGATASTTAGATIVSQTFSSTLLAKGVTAIDAGAMIHAGSTVIDSMPHGSFFHATGGSVNMQIKERMKLIPFEAMVGLTSTIVSLIIYLI
jgi:GntP family gluconate:H+ symporter